VASAWLANNPRITLHFTPTSGSWLNMVEIFFGIITRQAIRRGTFTSVKDLIAKIEASSSPTLPSPSRSAALSRDQQTQGAAPVC
jgi:hypothetical protein